jgi:hypothetical protein
MNPLTDHPYQQGITYTEHRRFAAGIAGRLLASGVAFIVHAVLPFVPIGSRLNLESTAEYVLERNRWIENAGGAVRGDAKPRLALSD